MSYILTSDFILLRITYHIHHLILQHKFFFYDEKNVTFFLRRMNN